DLRRNVSAAPGVGVWPPVVGVERDVILTGRVDATVLEAVEELARWRVLRRDRCPDLLPGGNDLLFLSGPLRVPAGRAQYEFQLASALGASSVGSNRPAVSVQQTLCLCNITLERGEALVEVRLEGAHEKPIHRLPNALNQLLVDGVLVDGQIERLAQLG